MKPIRESAELDWSGEHMKPSPAQAQPRKPDAATHSPLPWTMDLTPLPSPSGKNYISNAVTANGKLVGKLVGFSEDNAFHVIRAVNNAQRLADALRFTVAQLEDIAPNGSKHRGLAYPALKQGREAIAEWEGKTL